MLTCSKDLSVLYLLSKCFECCIKEIDEIQGFTLF